MPRELKHKPDTKTYHFENVNPKGRRTGDCVVRAIAKFTGKTWDEVYTALCELGSKIKAMPNDKATYERYIESLGYTKMPAPRKIDKKKYLGVEFCKIQKNCLMRIGGHHLSCIVDGKITDIWDCGDGSVGNYWIKVE